MNKNNKEEKSKGFKIFLFIITLFIVMTPFSVEAKKKSETFKILSKSIEQSGYFHRNIDTGKSLLYAQNNKTDIFYTNSFLNTNISVRRGDAIKIKADGNIRFGLFAGSGNPNGTSFGTNYNFFNGRPHGYLMGRIKQSGMQDSDGWFSIGEGIEAIAPNSGILELLVNDTKPEDNVGNFRVEVTIGSTPKIESKSYLSELKCDSGQLVNNNICVIKLSENLHFRRVARMGISESEISSVVLELYELKPNNANIAFEFVVNRHLNLVNSPEKDSKFPVVKASIKTDGEIIIDSKYGQFPPGMSPEEESASLIKSYQEEIRMLMSALTQTR